MAIEEDPPAGVPEWVVTYGDMMSLLLTFFIMLVSLSELKSDGQLRAMLDSIRHSFGVVDGPSGAPGKSPSLHSILNKLQSRGASGEGGIERHGRESAGLSGPNRTVRRINHGRVIAVGGPVPFDRPDAALSDAARHDLDVIAGILERRSDRVVVRGHAARGPLPAGSPFRDKLDLSFARARVVAEHLTSRGIPRVRLLVSAAGDSEPLAPTRDRDGQSRNDRVDVFAAETYIAPPQQVSPAVP